MGTISKIHSDIVTYIGLLTYAINLNKIFIMNQLQLVILCWLASSIFVRAQSVSWTNSNQTEIYTGYANILPLKFEDIDKQFLAFEPSIGTVEINEDGQYVWKVSKPGQTCVLVVKYKNKSITSFEKVSKRIPDPVIETMPRNATPSRFMGIRMVLPDVTIKLPMLVQSYDISINVGGDVSILTNKGGPLSDQNRKIMKRLPDSAIVNILNATGRCPGDKAARRLNAIQLQN